MTKLFIIILVSIYLFGSETYFYSLTQYNIDNYGYSYLTKNKTVTNDTNFITRSILGHRGYITKDLFVKAEINAYYTDIKYKGISGVYPMENILSVYLNNAYLTYKLTDNFGLSIGRFDFSYGSYTEISELDIEMGSGINKILSTYMDGFFILSKKKIAGYDTVFKLGYGVFNTVIRNGDSFYTDSNNGTDIFLFSLDAYQRFNNCKLLIFYDRPKYEGVNIGAMSYIGTSMKKYFIEDGITIFGVLGSSRNQLTLSKLNPNVKDKIDYGFMVNAGIAKDFESDIFESYNIGVSYTYANKDWYGLISKNYSDEINMPKMNGNNIYGWVTLKYDQDTALKIFYDRLVTNNVPTSDVAPVLNSIERYGVKLILAY